jgi:hypothetical protein
MRNVSDKRRGENQRTHVLCSINLSFENRTVCEIIWKNAVEPGRLQMTIWRMRVACKIPKATNTNSRYVIIIAFPLQQWLHEGVTMLRHTYSTVCLSCKLPSPFTLGSIKFIKIAFYNEVYPSRDKSFPSRHSVG